MELGPPLAELVDLHGTILLRTADDVDRDQARERLDRLRDEFCRISTPPIPPNASSTCPARLCSRPACGRSTTLSRDWKNDRYGRCIVCNAVIPDERLAVMPDTPFCLKDAQRERSRAQ